MRFAELTSPPRFSTFFRQRPRRFAPNFGSGIFIVHCGAGCLKK
jgi:hypothetical protein